MLDKKLNHVFGELWDSKTRREVYMEVVNEANVNIAICKFNGDVDAATTWTVFRNKYAEKAAKETARIQELYPEWKRLKDANET